MAAHIQDFYKMYEMLSIDYEGTKRHISDFGVLCKFCNVMANLWKDTTGPLEMGTGPLAPLITFWISLI